MIIYCYSFPSPHHDSQKFIKFCKNPEIQGTNCSFLNITWYFSYTFSSCAYQILGEYGMHSLSIIFLLRFQCSCRESGRSRCSRSEKDVVCLYSWKRKSTKHQVSGRQETYVSTAEGPTTAFPIKCTK